MMAILAVLDRPPEDPSAEGTVEIPADEPLGASEDLLPSEEELDGETEV